MRSHAADNSASVLAVGLPERRRGQRCGALERANEGALLGVAELKRDLVQRAATPLQRVLGELDTLLLHDIGELHAHACQRSEEHTSELQSLMRISYAVFCLKKKKTKTPKQKSHTRTINKTTKTKI